MVRTARLGGKVEEAVGIPVDRIKLPVEVHVFVPRHPHKLVSGLNAVLHAPTDFRAGDSGGSPVNEEAELRVAKPLKAFLALFGSFGELRDLGRSLGGGQAEP